jgi:predicted ATPase
MRGRGGARWSVDQVGWFDRSRVDRVAFVVITRDTGSVPTLSCQNCGKRIPTLHGTARPPRYCSSACRQRAYRQRRKTQALPRQQPVGLCSYVSSFHGREDDLASAGRLCAASRLVTVVGEPGVGKSRLAIELVKILCRTTKVSAMHVDIGALGADGPPLPDAIAAAAGITVGTDETVMDLVVRGIVAQGQSRLVLDNCEHRLDECGALLGVLLPQCPRLRVLATSREVIRLPGESVYSLSGLTVPEHPFGDPAECDTAAVRLFVDRARSACHTFVMTGSGSAAVAGICFRLGGNPLAIEMAAALVRVLSPVEILDKLADRFTLLESGWRTADERHRGLWDAIDWSYQRLGADEQAALRRIAVLPGRFGLDTAVAVVMDPGPPDPPLLPVLQALRGLESRSLLATERRTAETTWFRMAESVRLFALDHLGSCGERRAAELGLVGALHRLASSVCDAVVAPGPVLSQLVEERNNLSRAVEVLEGTDDDRQLALAVALVSAEDFDGQDRGGRRALAAGLRLATPTARHRSSALAAAAELACRDGDDRTAVDLADAAVETAHHDGDETALARQLRTRAAVHAVAGDLTASVHDIRLALDLVAEQASLMCRVDLVWYLLGQGELDGARSALAAVEADGLTVVVANADTLDPGSAADIAVLLYTMGAVRLCEEEIDAAARCFADGLLLSSGHWLRVPLGLEAMAVVAWTARRPERALRLLGAAERLRSDLRVRADAWWGTGSPDCALTSAGRCPAAARRPRPEPAGRCSCRTRCTTP